MAARGTPALAPGQALIFVVIWAKRWQGKTLFRVARMDVSLNMNKKIIFSTVILSVF
jgi:hypothetical protein